MEIKVTIGLDEKTTILVQNLTNALLGAKVPAAQVVEPEDEPKQAKAKPSKTKPSKVEKVEESIAEETTIEEVEKEAEEAEEVVTHTIDEVRSEFASAKRSGKPNDQLKAILKKYDASIVSELDPKNYAAVIAAIKKL